MKTIKYFILINFLLASVIGASQVTDDNNNSSATNFVGFNGGNNPLPIRNDGDADINIWRNNIQKFRISELDLWEGLDGLEREDVQRTTLGLQGQDDLAWSILHFWDDAAGSLGSNMQRDWFNVGTSMTTNWDFMYVGLMERPTSSSDLNTDAVITWGCQDGPTIADHFRFLFIQDETQGGHGPSSEQGLELMRITPWGNVGIGDFSEMPNALNSQTYNYGQPNARLDVQYFGDRPHSTSDIALNVRNIARHETGTEDYKYGIYTYSENFYDEDDLLYNTGIVGRARGARYVVGISGSATRGNVFTNAPLKGVVGSVTESTENSQNTGVEGYAQNAASGGHAYAIYGHSPGLVDHWAGYFNGRTWCTSGMWTGSDESLKENLNQIENASEILSQLETISFNWRQDIAQINTEEGLHYGVIAQQLEEVLPELVTEVSTPTTLIDGKEVEPLSFKSVRYQDLIPILIAGFNEQSQVIAAQDSLTKSKNGDIEQLEDKIQKLEEQLNSISGKMQKIQQDTDDCCNLKNQTQSGGSTEDNSGNQLKLEQNVPNPFQERTRIDFEIPENAQVKLEITDKVGKVVEVLMEGNLQSGTYSTTWNGASYPSGVYYYSLYANGQLLTKKMIKQ